MSDAITMKVLAARLEEARHELDKLVRKAHRFGCPEVAYTVGPVYQEERTYEDWDGSPRKIMVDCHDVTVTGTAPKVGDFEFIAKLEHTEGGVIIDMVPGAEGLDTRFRTHRQECEHCKARRFRKHTFVVRERSTGRQIQVGHNCIHDFMGVNLANVLFRFGLFRVGQDREDWGGASYIPEARSVESILTLGHVIVRLFGYCSRATAEVTGAYATSWYVGQMFRNPADMAPDELAIRKQIREAKTEADLVAAREVRAWAIEQTQDSEYMHNLRTLCAGETIPPKRQGYVVSAISAHAKAMERALRLTVEREARKNSQHVGTVGERLKGLSLIFQSARVIGGNNFADCCLWKLQDDAGNQFNWFTSKGTDLRPGERVTLDATVKAHREYQGAKETQLTRCKIVKAKVA